MSKERAKAIVAQILSKEDFEICINLVDFITDILHDVAIDIEDRLTQHDNDPRHLNQAIDIDSFYNDIIHEHVDPLCNDDNLSILMTGLVEKTYETVFKQNQKISLNEFRKKFNM